MIGKAIIHKVDGTWTGGLIVETEAYLAVDDLASHSARGLTKSNASMFAAAGTLYVYPIHAKYCMNVVTESEGSGAAVLLRAIEPIWGIDAMQIRRGHDDIRRLTRGPAMLCQALQVDRRLDGHDLIRSKSIRLASIADNQSFEVDDAPRIGISKAQDLPLRFTLRGSRFLSR